MEEWRDIPGYEGLYQVSDHGNVRSLNYKKQGVVGLLYLKRHPKGYRQVELSKDGIKRMMTVHRLVALTFIPNPNECAVVNHLNEDKADNRKTNLEWCTKSHNVRYSMERHPRIKHAKHTKHTAHRKRVLKRTYPVAQFTTEGVFVRKWDNLMAIKHTLNLNEYSISECCKGHRKTAYGFKWQYAI